MHLFHFFFFLPLRPQSTRLQRQLAGFLLYLGYDCDWKKLQKHSAGVTSVIHPVGRSKSSRWSVFNAENYSRSGASVACARVQMSLQKNGPVPQPNATTHTNMNWDPTNEMYRATKQHINTHIYTDQLSHHIHKQTPPADAAPLPVSGVVHCDLSAWSPWRDSLLILTRRGLMQDNPDYEWHRSQ